MAKVFIEETTLTAIGDAIREKEGTTELVPVTDMATRISAISGGGGGGNEPTDEELTVTGNCSYRFAYGSWDWFLEKYGNRITTKDITQADCMFEGCKVTSIPFDINVKSVTNLTRMFYNTLEISVCPKVRGTINWTTSTNLSSMLYYMRSVRDLEDLFLPEMLDGYAAVKITSGTSAPRCLNLMYSQSLRRVPSWWYKFRINPESTAYPQYSRTIYNQAFSYCHSLDEVTDMPVLRCQGAQTANMFSGIVTNCGRVRHITFETNSDGSPVTTQWKSQTIDLLINTGYASLTSQITSYNSGITADKEVKTDEDYQTLKNDPDWFTTKIAYSRYNHDSAVETINSLPDTSAYLATASGTNTIKFQGSSGSATDGGAINTLTEEEIAVATAKGWTVTFG